MDAARFDRLTRRLAATQSRRGFLAGVAGLTVATVVQAPTPKAAAAGLTPTICAALSEAAQPLLGVTDGAGQPSVSSILRPMVSSLQSMSRQMVRALDRCATNPTERRCDGAVAATAEGSNILANLGNDLDVAETSMSNLSDVVAGMFTEARSCGGGLAAACSTALDNPILNRGFLKDVLNPRTSSFHRSMFRSVSTGSGAVYRLLKRCGTSPESSACERLDESVTDLEERFEAIEGELSDGRLLLQEAFEAFRAMADQVIACRFGTDDLCSGIECDDGDPCTVDRCVAGECVHDAVAGCCTSDDACPDQDACAIGVCNLVSNVCETSSVAGCCTADDHCPGGECLAGRCDTASNTCRQEPIEGCCATDDQCPDADVCNRGACDPSSRTCVIEPIPGCCTTDEQCDDGNVCTADSCDLVSNTCSHQPVPGCCPDGQSSCNGDCCAPDEVCDGPGGTCGCPGGLPACNGVCCGLNQTCRDGVFCDTVACLSTRQACASHDECCSGICATTCQCNPSTCVRDDDCCSLNCVDGACECAAPGASCASDAGCCSGRCSPNLFCVA